MRREESWRHIVVEKAFEANKKEFWSFVGRRTRVEREELKH